MVVGSVGPSVVEASVVDSGVKVVEASVVVVGGATVVELPSPAKNRNTFLPMSMQNFILRHCGERGTLRNHSAHLSMAMMTISL